MKKTMLAIGLGLALCMSVVVAEELRWVRVGSATYIDPQSITKQGGMVSAWVMRRGDTTEESLVSLDCPAMEASVLRRVSKDKAGNTVELGPIPKELFSVDGELAAAFDIACQIAEER